MVEPRAPLKLLCLLIAVAPLVACGNGGHVDFAPDSQTVSEKNAGFNMVPASRALATSATGYSAKLQLNPVAGTDLKAGNGYSARMKFTVRNR